MSRNVGIALLSAVALTLALASSAAAAASFEARGSAKQVHVTDLTPGAEVTLLNASDAVVETRDANDLGGALFRDVAPGPGYKVTSGGETSDPLTVLSEDPTPPSTDIYDQDLTNDGYGYLTTRDGTELAYSVHPPLDAANALGYESDSEEYLALAGITPPFPTLVEYSGYGYARPEGPQSGIATVANLMGFAVVDVNMRGTGCSGGAFDFFEPLQNLDGYDIIETVARQDWVSKDLGGGGDVGMLGISYGGISQLFTAQTQPPNLKAIAPLSVIDQVQTTLYPGGILNTGFALAWAAERAQQARPAPDGQGWANDQIAAEGPDGPCAANQALHAEAPDLLGKVRDNDTYKPEVADPLSPLTFVDKIEVPTFMACQWTDEQTGGHCPTLATRLPDTPGTRITFTNGTHVDSLSPEILNQMYDFLHIYVAEQDPSTFAALFQATAPAVFQAVFGIDGPGGAPPAMTQPADPIQALPHAAAKVLWESQDPIRVLFDNGGGSNDAGAPYPDGWPFPAFEQSFPSWPAPGVSGRAWYVGPDGSLADQPPTDDAADMFTWDADARSPTDFTGNTGTGGLWGATPNYEWSPEPAGSAVAYETEPLSEDTTVLGSGRVDLWLRSSEPRADLQATISEIRPDGKEVFVQGGWLRGDLRKLDGAKSTLLEPFLSLREQDIDPLPSDRFVPATIPLYYEGHAYREGSRIRVKISAPNGDQPVWSFAETKPDGQAQVEIGYGPEMTSRLLMPVVPGADVPTGLPPCPGLRGEPCRDYTPIENMAAPDDPDPGGGGNGGGNGNGNGGGSGNGNGGGSSGGGEASKPCVRSRAGGGGNEIRGDAGDNRLKGTPLSDYIQGFRGDDTLKGLSGDDCLRAARGDDLLKGQAGDDWLNGSAGDDVLIGGEGFDRYRAGVGDDKVRARDGERDVIGCGKGDDLVIADFKDKVHKTSCETVKRRGRKKSR